MKKNIIFKMVYCSIMAAMAYVCTLFEIPLSFTVTLYGIPLIFVGIMFGPIYGVLTGLIAGFLEQMKYGISLQTFLWLLAPITWGGLSGLLYYGLKKLFNDNKTYKKIIIYTISILLCAIFANVFNSFALAILGFSSKPITDLSMFIVYASSRLGSIPIHVVIYVPICFIICESIKKSKIFG